MNADVHSSCFPFVYSGPQMHSVCCFPYSGCVFPHIKSFWKYTKCFRGILNVVMITMKINHDKTPPSRVHLEIEPRVFECDRQAFDS